MHDHPQIDASKIDHRLDPPLRSRALRVPSERFRDLVLLAPLFTRTPRPIAHPTQRFTGSTYRSAVVVATPTSAVPDIPALPDHVAQLIDEAIDESKRVAVVVERTQIVC